MGGRATRPRPLVAGCHAGGRPRHGPGNGAGRQL